MADEKQSTDVNLDVSLGQLAVAGTKAIRRQNWDGVSVFQEKLAQLSYLSGRPDVRAQAYRLYMDLEGAVARSDGTAGEVHRKANQANLKYRDYAAQWAQSKPNKDGVTQDMVTEARNHFQLLRLDDERLSTPGLYDNKEKFFGLFGDEPPSEEQLWGTKKLANERIADLYEKTSLANTATAVQVMFNPVEKDGRGEYVETLLGRVPIKDQLERLTSKEEQVRQALSSFVGGGGTAPGKAGGVIFESMDVFGGMQKKAIQQAYLVGQGRFVDAGLGPEGAALVPDAEAYANLVGTEAANMDPEGFLWNVPTRDPALVLPYLPDIFDGDLLKSYEFFQTARGTRALKEFLAQKEEEGGLKTTWGEKAQRSIGLLADFGVTTAVGYAALGGVGPGLKALTPARVAGRSHAMKFWGTTGKRLGRSLGYVDDYAKNGARAWRAVGTTWDKKNIAEEVWYGVARAMVQGRDPWEGAAEGWSEGLFEAFTFAGYRGLRLGAAAGSRHIPFIKGPIRRRIARNHLELNQRTASFVDEVLRMADAPSGSQQFLRRMDDSALKNFAGHEFRKNINRRMVDAMAMGAWFGAWSDAQLESGADWEGMSGSDKAVETFKNLLSVSSLINSVVYGAHSGLFAGANAAKMRMDNLPPEIVQKYQNAVEAALQDAMQPENFAATEKMVAAFENITKDSPPIDYKNRAWSEYESTQESEARWVNTELEDVGLTRMRAVDDPQGADAYNWVPVRALKSEGVDGPDIQPMTENELALGAARVWVNVDPESDGHTTAIKMVQGAATGFILVDPADMKTRKTDAVFLNMEEAAAAARELGSEQEVEPGEELQLDFSIPGSRVEEMWKTTLAHHEVQMAGDALAGHPKYSKLPFEDIGPAFLRDHPTSRKEGLRTAIAREMAKHEPPMPVLLSPRFKQNMSGPRPTIDAIAKGAGETRVEATRWESTGLKAMNILQGAGIIPDGMDLDSVMGRAFLVDGAQNPDLMEQRFLAMEGELGGKENAIALAQEFNQAAWDTLAIQQRMTIKVGDALGLGDVVRGIYEVQDNLDELTPKRRKQLKKLKVLDRFGGIHPGTVRTVQDAVQGQLDSMVPDAPPVATSFIGRNLNPFYRDPRPVAEQSSGARVFIDKMGELGYSEKALEKGQIGKALTAPFRGIHRTALWFQRQAGRPAGGAANPPLRIPELGTTTEGAVSNFQTDRAQTQAEIELMAAGAAKGNASLERMFGGLGVSPKIRSDLVKMINNGDAKYMSPEQAEAKYGKFGRGLLKAAHNWMESLNAVGQGWVDVGLMDEKQLEAHIDQYVHLGSIKQDFERRQDHWKQQEYAGVLAKRNLERYKDGGEYLDQIIYDPLQLEYSLETETRALNMMRALRSSVASNVGLPRSSAEALPAHVRKNWATLYAAGEEKSPDKIAAKTDPINGRPYEGWQIDLTFFIDDLMRTTRKKGEKYKPFDGKRPYTPEMGEFFDLVTGKDPVAIPVGVGQELEQVWHYTFPQYEQGSNLFNNVSVKVNEWKGNLTAGRLRFWNMRLWSDILLSNEGGVASIWDFATGNLFNRGPVAEAYEAANVMREYRDLGGPKTKPADWDSQKWAKAQEVMYVAKKMHGATATEGILRSGALNDFSGFVNREGYEINVRQNLERQSLNQTLDDAVAEHMARVQPTLFDREAKKFERWGVEDPNWHARVVLDHLDEFQVMEFVPRYANYRKIKATQPWLSTDEMIRKASRPVGDMRDISPQVAMHMNDLRIYGHDTRPGAAARGNFSRLAIAATFASPFRLWFLQTVGQMGRNLRGRWTHVGASLALGAGALRMMEDSEDPEAMERWFKDMSDSFRSPSRAYTSEEQIDVALARFSESFPFFGDLSGEDQQFAKALFRRFMTGTMLEARAPSPTFESRTSDVSQYMGSFEAVQTVKDAAGNLIALADPSTTDRRRAAERFRDQFFGQYIQTGFAATFGALDFLKNATQGIPVFYAREGVKRDKAKHHMSQALDAAADTFMRVGGDLFSQMRPTPGFVFSKPVQRHAEVAGLRGQRLLENWKGMGGNYRMAGSQAVRQAFYESMVTSQREIPYRKIDDDATVWDAVTDIIFGQQLSGSMQREATRGVANEVADIMRASHADYLDVRDVRVGHGDQYLNRLSLEDLRARIARETALDLDVTYSSELEDFVLNDQPMSRIGKYIAQDTNKSSQQYKIRAAMALFESPGFQSNAMATLIEAASMKKVTPSEFYVMSKAASKPDNGRALVKLFRKMHAGGDNTDQAAATYRVFEVVMRDLEGTEDLQFREDIKWLKGFYNPLLEGGTIPPKRPSQQPSLEGAVPKGPFGIGSSRAPMRSSQLGVELGAPFGDR